MGAVADSTKFIETKISKTSDKTVYKKAVKNIPTHVMVREILYRHRVGFLIVGNVVLVLNFLVPQWFQMILAIFQ